MGEVYEAFDPMMMRNVGIKTAIAHRTGAGIEARFLREVRGLIRSDLDLKLPSEL